MFKGFARIIQSTDGRQVLFYVEPDGGDYLLHQIAEHQGCQADLKIGFTSTDEDENERRAYAVLGAFDQSSADKVIGIIVETIGETT